MCRQIDAPAATKLTGATNQPVEESLQLNCSTDSTLLANYPDVLDTADVSDVLGIPVVSVRAMLRQEQLPYFKIGSQYRAPKLWLLDWINSNSGGVYNASI